jgi:multidrug transporter EmrE-like cation transporter
VPRHDVDLLSLMAGVGFAGVAVVGLIGQGADVAARWTWPLLLILIGVVGLVAARRGTRP